MKSSLGSLAPAILLVAALIGTADKVYGQQLPKTLIVMAESPGKTTSLVLQEVKYVTGPAAPNTKVAGTATFRLRVSGIEVPALPGIPFQALTAGPDGKVTAATFNKDISIPNVANTGLDLVLQRGFQVTAVTPSQVTLTGAMQVVLPYRSDKGERARASLGGSSAITLRSDGDLSAAFVDGALVSPDGFTLAGCTFRGLKIDVSFARSGGANVWSITLPGAIIHMGIPTLLTQESQPLMVSAETCEIDQNGNPSFKKGHLLQAPNPRKPGAVSPLHISIHLVKPLDFALLVKSASVEMQKGSVTTLLVTADVALPEMYHAPGDGGDRVVIEDVNFDLQKGFLVKIAEGKTIDLEWNDWTIEKAITVLDLSETTAVPSIYSGASKSTKETLSNPLWEGLYIASAKLKPPKGLSLPEGKLIGIAGFYIDGHGVTGEKELPPGFTCGILGFHVTFDKGGNVQFNRGHLTAGMLAGQVDIGKGGQWGTLPLRVTISDAGILTPDIDTSKPLEIKPFGMKVDLVSATLKPNFDFIKQKPSLIMLSGCMTFPGVAKLADAAFTFQDLGISSDGSFALDEDSRFTLTHPTTIDVGPMAVDVQQIGVAKDGKTIGLNGDVRLSGDFPVVDSDDFQGMVIAADISAKPRPALDIGDIGSEAKRFETDLMGIVQAQCHLRYVEQSPNDYLTGDAAIGFGGGYGGEIDFRVGRGFWWIHGDVSLGDTGIPLGNTGISLYAFEGGLGHNVTLKESAGEPEPAPESGNWVFSAGIDLGLTGARDTAWANGQLSLQLPQFALDITAKAYFLEPYVSPIDRRSHNKKPAEDRTASLEVYYDSDTDVFDAWAAAQFYYPNSDHYCLRAGGNVHLHLSPDKKFFYIGYPDPVHIYTPVLGLEGGLAADIEPGPLRIKGRVAATIHWGVLKGGIAGSLELVAPPAGAFTADVEAWGAIDVEVAEVSVSGSLGVKATENGKVGVYGQVEGCISVGLGDICASMEFGSSGDPFWLP